jgi:GT2 family glycosyltransferase
MTSPAVTIVVPPRDRFSCVRRSLESIYQHTTHPFELVYVDGNSPPHVSKYLEREAKKRHFNLIRSDRFLSPNQARNVGLKEVRTKYVAFVDNDVEVTPGWLTHLVGCAEETGAWAVAPLVFEGPLDQQVIHIFGGQAEFSGGDTGRTFHEDHLFNGRTLREAQSEIQRTRTDFAEFHCVLMRRELFDELGPCDEGFLSLQEHLDVSLLITQAGGSVYAEPEARVAFPYDSLLDRYDIEYARLRWSDDWNRRSTQHFVEKWKIDPASPWVAASIGWGNSHREHLERLRRRPLSMMKRAVKGILPAPAYKALQALRG